MASDQLEQVDGAVAGGWILPELRDGFGGYVKQQVPQIYEAYVRILHPASEGGADVTWAEVARRLGTIPHREMQWHAIVGSWDPTGFRDSRWPGGEPWPGELREDKLDSLCSVLGEHTSTPEIVYFGMSTIQSGVAEEWSDAPQLEQPAREWVVLRGPLAAVGEITLSDRHGIVWRFYPKGQEPPPDYEPPEQFHREVPNLIWPEDRAWFVACDVDLDSTLVGGSRSLIEAILSAPELEAWEVDGEVSLQADADKLNPVPDPPPGANEPRDPEALTREGFKDQLEWVSGTIAAAATEGGVLEIEVEGAPGWSIEAAHSTWTVDQVARLVGAVVERAEVDPETDALRLRLADGAFEIVPLPWKPGDPPSWRVRMTDTPMAMKHGPELLFEFLDED
jgi:hypothetical protein